MEKKEKYSFAYDPVAALRNCPELLGMELREHGNQLEGGYYLDGSKHPYRRDKLKCFIWKGRVFVQEEGGQCLSLENWLQQYGGAADYREAIGMIKGKSQALHWHREFREKKTDMCYVGKDVLEAAKRYDLRTCPLFTWMCRLFPEECVWEAWDKYNVTTDSHGNAVFWYVDQNGRILYDKRIAYKGDGHRDRGFFPGRQYRVSDGYSGKCYFGACLPEDGRKAFIVESEKSALLAYLYYGRKFLATGGKGNLREVEPNMMLVPDMDARMEWEEKGEVWPWWEKWGLPLEEIPVKADIGDMIVAKKSLSLQKL